MQRCSPQPYLPQDISRLIQLRKNSPALKYGDYRQIYVNHEQLVFSRSYNNETLFVAVNAAGQPVEVRIPVPDFPSRLLDRLNNQEEFLVSNHECRVTLPPHWARVLQMA
jgi:hypothetical protein